MMGNGSDPEAASEDSRLVSLEQRLDRAEAAEAKRTAGNAGPESDANYRLGNRVLAELLGGLIGGALFGWLIDRFAGTSPWGLLGMLFMGIVVAFRNIIRISSTSRK
ncbi:MAG: AtpZ/AtpI family protein [Sphingopyxis sp.]|nr:AtpZ/AtpI family protein [Sphingopyxis sp.]